MKQTLDKLYGFIARLVLMLDEELDELRSKKNKRGPQSAKKYNRYIKQISEVHYSTEQN
jgi:hypothetical protein